MKKIISVLFAMLLLLSATAFAEDKDVTGEWYGSMMGVNITLLLNEDGTYEMTMAGMSETNEGTWEVRDDAVVVDPGTETEESFAYDGETLSMKDDEYEMVLTREPVESFVPADPMEDAELEDYAGEWVSGMISAMGVTMDGSAAGLEMKVKVEETKVTLDSASMGFSDASFDAEFKDGVLIFEQKLDEEDEEEEAAATVKLQMLEDGMMAISMRVPTLLDQDVLFYMTPAEEAETETETETEAA